MLVICSFPAVLVSAVRRCLVVVLPRLVEKDVPVLLVEMSAVELSDELDEVLNRIVVGRIVVGEDEVDEVLADEVSHGGSVVVVCPDSSVSSSRWV